MLKDFDKFMSQLKETNQTLDFFCDFDKISENVEDIKLSLCMLNSLIGASDLRKSVETIWNRDKNAFSVMDILIAVRTRDKKKILDSVGNCVPLESMFISVDYDFPDRYRTWCSSSKSTGKESCGLCIWH